MSQRVLGIDLGTVNSCVAVVQDGRAVVLSENSRTTIPSCLAFQRGKEVVGEAAKRQAVTDPHGTIIAVKRLMGHSHDSIEVEYASHRVPYEIKPSPVGGVTLDVGGREMTPVQVSARILQRIREVAENALGEPVQKAVISVPAHFTDVQRKATKLAAEYAGLEPLRLINEPTAAAFAYGYRRGEDFRLAVYDLGGGTFDITVMSAAGDCFRVEATDGDSYLGGEDFDHVIVDFLAQQFKVQHGVDPLDDPAARLRLREAAERAKVELADLEEAQIELPILTQLADGSRPNFTCSLSRQKLAELTKPLIDRSLELCDECLTAAGIERMDIDEILVVGGQSRMHAVREAVREFFGKEPRRDINPDEVVAMGAALYGYSIAAEEIRQHESNAAEEAYAVAIKDTMAVRRLIDGVEQIRGKTLNDQELARRLEALLAQTEADGPLEGLPPLEDPDCRLPEALNDLQETLLGLEGRAEQVMQEFMDELGEEEILGESKDAANRAVQRVSEALESARQASHNAQDHLREADSHGKARKVDLIDVTSHALGLASAGDLFMPLIEKNVSIPVEQTRSFTTNHDDQTEVEIRVCQGSASKASENQFLGAFVLEGIQPGPRMETRISVTFKIDEDGILSVHARDSASGAEQSIRVEDPLNLQSSAAMPDLSSEDAKEELEQEEEPELLEIENHSAALPDQQDGDLQIGDEVIDDLSGEIEFDD